MKGNCVYIEHVILKNFTLNGDVTESMKALEELSLKWINICSTDIKTGEQKTTIHCDG